MPVNSERDREDDPEQPAHDVEAEDGERCVNGREDERERDEGQSVSRHRIDDRLRTEPSRESLCSEPVRRRDHAVGRRE